MTSIAIPIVVFKATIGLLVNKGRDLAAEKLEDGDVTHQQFRKFIVREIDDIKSKLDGFARKDLLASLDFFKEGLVFLYQLFDRTTSGELATATGRAATGTEEEKLLKPSVNTGSLAKGLKKYLCLTELDEPAKKALSDSKTMFNDARRTATEAFSNEALKTSDRILAMTIRVMATLLEKVDNTATALASCRMCLDELHNMPAVQKSFNAELSKGFKSLLNRNERGEVISNVLHINFVIYNVTQMVSYDWCDTFTLPCIDIGKEIIDPLREARVAKTMREFNMDHCCVMWSFGQEGKKEHRLRGPVGITTNTQGQFIVADHSGQNVKVFNTSGKFLYSLCPPTDDGDKELRFLPSKVVTDGEDNVYVLATLKRGDQTKWVLRVKRACTEEWGQGVFVFDQHANLHHKFPLREGSNGFSVTVSDHHEVFVLVERDDGSHVEVYNTDGQFVHSFGQGILKDVCDIAAANDDRVMVFDLEFNIDWKTGTCFTESVHVFSAQGDHLHQFIVHECILACGGIAFHQGSEHVISSSQNLDNQDRGQVSIYTKDGELVRSIQLGTKKRSFLGDVTVTVDGRIAVTSYDGMVYVV